MSLATQQLRMDRGMRDDSGDAHVNADPERCEATWYRQLYGLPVGFNFALPVALPEAHGTPVLSVLREEFDLSDDSPATEVYRSRHALPDGSPTLIINRRSDGDQLHFPNLAHFLVAADRIVVNPAATADPDLLTARLLGPVMAYWLERRSITVLHASAVATRVGAIAFLSYNGGGKSTLAAAMMRRGNPLLADDMLAVAPEADAIVAYPSYPEMRMWPESAGLFVEDPGRCARVHSESSKLRLPVDASAPGGFCAVPVPLKSLYLPSRRPSNAAPIIETLPPALAAKALISHSFVPHLAEVVRDPGERLDAIARVADELPLKKISFTDDMQQLDQVCESLLEDLGATPTDEVMPFPR